MIYTKYILYAATFSGFKLSQCLHTFLAFLRHPSPSPRARLLGGQPSAKGPKSGQANAPPPAALWLSLCCNILTQRLSLESPQVHNSLKHKCTDSFYSQLPLTTPFAMAWCCDCDVIYLPEHCRSTTIKNRWRRTFPITDRCLLLLEDFNIYMNIYVYITYNSVPNLCISHNQRAKCIYIYMWKYWCVHHCIMLQAGFIQPMT